MKKRLTAIFLSLCMLLTLLPATAFAAGTQKSENPSITVGGVDLDGSAETPAYATTNETDKVTTEGASETNYNVKWDGETLTLRDATVVESTQPAAIERQAPFTLKLEGRNSITSLNDSDTLGIIARCDHSLIEGDANIDPDTLDALTICGDGSLDVTGTVAGISSAGNLIIKSGTVTATATTAQSTNPSFGIGTMEVGNIYIEGGKVTAIGGASSTFSAGFYIMVMSNENTGQVPGGTVRITGGEVTAVGGEITETTIFPSTAAISARMRRQRSSRITLKGEPTDDEGNDKRKRYDGGRQKTRRSGGRTQEAAGSARGRPGSERSDGHSP